jgi:hypothetical protein
VARPRCRREDCGHTPAWHGERAGTEPGRCLVESCTCEYWVAVPTPAPADPRTDRDLYLAWCAATYPDVDAAAGYEIMMAEIESWHRRSLGLPPLPQRPAVEHG